MKEIVLDTETTGLSIKDGHRIVEIGCVELDNLVPTSNKFHCYLNPERKVSEKALEVHGYTNKFLGDKKKFREIVDDFHCLDEAQIFTIATASVQELDRQLQAEKAKTTQLQAQMADVLLRLNVLEV